MSTTSLELTPQRAQALFDLLIHHQTYFVDCIRFNREDGIKDYGPPFDPTTTPTLSTAPILQTLLYRFVLPLPGVRSFSPTFWDNVKQLMERFAGANLSDSYDHAGIGLRRTLATGAAALLEYPAKGVFGHLERKEPDASALSKHYDLEDPDDLKDAFEIFNQQVVHGTLIDELFDKVAATADLSEHSSMVQAAHEYMLVHLASVLHYIFIESPDAIYTQKLMSNLLKLVPWTMLKQSLRIGNAATMINAVTRLFLTKLSLTSITNWFGLSNNPDDGMNLMQQIVSTILNWDISDYKRKLEAVKKSEHAPGKQYLEVIGTYIDSDGDNQRRVRKISQDESKSIVTVIFEEASLPILEGRQHDQAIEYLAMRSSYHDREQISQIACYSRPDILTQSIKEGITAYDPIIRGVHKAVDLSGSCQDLENFLYEFMALFESSPQKNTTLNGLKSTGTKTPSTVGARTTGTRTPDPSKAKVTSEAQLKHRNVTVEEFAQVLRHHQKALHVFIHQLAKNGGGVIDEYKDYAKAAAAQFKATSTLPKAENQIQNSGGIIQQLDKLVAELPETKQTEVIGVVDMYSGYLTALTCVTNDRLRGILSDSSSDVAGPGTFLARWERLLESTPTTPITANGKVRFGSSRVNVAEKSHNEAAKVPDQWRWPEAPDVKIVVEALGDKFGKLLAEMAKQHWIKAQHDVD